MSPAPPLYRSCAVDTPVGDVVVVFDGSDVVAVRTGDERTALESLARRHRIVCEPDPAPAEHVARQFDEYFAGERREFDLPLSWRLTSGFAREALQRVCDIPYGETASYGEVAAMAGRPRAARAVGTACRTTPFSIVVPVHRVVRADGSLGEYGGNEAVKRFLVDLEYGRRRENTNIEE